MASKRPDLVLSVYKSKEYRPHSLRDVQQEDVSRSSDLLHILLAAAKDRYEYMDRRSSNKRLYIPAIDSDYASEDLVLYEHLKNITTQIISRASGRSSPFVDEITLCSAMDLANAVGDAQFTSFLWRRHTRLSGQYSSRAFHSYMRSFRRSQQSQPLGLAMQKFSSWGLTLDLRTCDEIVNAHTR